MKLFQVLVALFVCAFLPVCAASLEDLTYTTTNGKVAITDCDEAAVGELVIPDTIEGNPVTSIGDRAYQHCIGLKSITIPEVVISIGESAFNGCTSLSSITIPDKVSRIEDFTFYGCTSLENITIGNGVTSIKDGAFRLCSSLSSIKFKGAAPTLGAEAFKGVAAVAFVTPKALKSFGKVGGKWNGLTLKTSSESIATDPKKVGAGHLQEKELILLSSHLDTVDADFPDLLKKREGWKNLRIEAQLKIDTAYFNRLKKLKTTMVRKGEIADARAIDRAIKGGTRTDNEPAVLTKSRQVRYTALLGAMKPIDQQYWKNLKKLKEDVQSQGDLERIEIILSEIERVLAPYK